MIVIVAIESCSNSWFRMCPDTVNLLIFQAWIFAHAAYTI